MLAKNYILGILLLLSSFSLYAIKEPDYYVRRDAQLFTEGDYGLELDWGKNEDQYWIGSITTDRESNIYVAGSYNKSVVFPNGIIISNDYPHMDFGQFLAKLNKNGDLIWVKNMVSGNRISINNIYFTENNSNLIVDVNFIPSISPSLNPPYNIDYDNKTIYVADTNRVFEFLVKIDTEDGGLIDYVKLDVGGKSDPQSEYFMNLSVSDDGEIYLYTFIGESFEGLDTTRLKTTTRTHGGADAYFAKINADFSLAWDFAIGGDRHDVPWVPEAYYYEYYGYFNQMDDWAPCWMVKKEDTLIAKISIFSDGVDIDPDPDKETILNTKWNNDAAVVKYYIGNDKPELISYKYDYANYLPHYLSVANDGHLYSLDYEKYEGSDIWYNKNSYNYREVDSNMKTHKADGYKYNLKNPYDVLHYSSNYAPISFDNNSDMYIALTAPKNVDSINIQLTDTLFVKSMPDRTATNALAKYGNDENLKWCILWPLSHWAQTYNFDNEGGLYISGGGLRTAKDTTDVDPNPDNEFVMTASYGVFLRYVETYRVKPASTEYGKIIAPDKLVRWGNSAEVSVVPDSGYEVDEVSTSRGEKLEKNANGKYIVENVTDVVTVNATFKKSSAVDDIYSSRVRIYPNPVEDLLTIESEGRLTDAVIYNAQGKEILSILENTINVDVNTLPAGIYTLKAKLDDIPVVKQFVKK